MEVFHGSYTKIDRFLDIALSKYKSHPEQFSSKAVCFDFVVPEEYYEEGDLYSKYVSLMSCTEAPSKDILKNAQFLYFNHRYSNQAIASSSLEMLSEMINLKYIRLPLPFALCLTNELVPPNLEFFHVLNREGDVDLICSNKKDYASKIVFPNIILPNVKALSITNLSYSIKTEDYLRISNENFPNLEYLSCSSAVNIIKEFNSLKHLALYGVDKVNVFDYINSPLISLHIEGAGKVFNLVEMKRFSSIEMIRFNSIDSDIDCTHFLDMPNLKEIFMLNTSNIKNIDALLNIESLKSLELVNCKKGMNKSQKMLFKANEGKFDRLEIDYIG
jgi:hypothetical protein